MSSNFRAVNLMETLQKSGDVVEKFENIIEECKNKKIKYVDPDFYPQKNIIDNDKTILEEHDWRRIEDQYHILFENISYPHILLYLQKKSILLQAMILHKKCLLKYVLFS